MNRTTRQGHEVLPRPVADRTDVFVSYLAAALVSQLLGSWSTATCVLWPAAGVAFGYFARSGGSLWPAFALAGFIQAVVFLVLRGQPIPQALGAAVGVGLANTLAPWLASQWVVSAARRGQEVPSGVFFGAAVLHGVVGAALGTSALIGTGVIRPEQGLAVLLIWLIADTMSVVGFAPWVLDEPGAPLRGRDWVLLALGAAWATFFAVDPLALDRFFPVAWLCLAPMVAMSAHASSPRVPQLAYLLTAAAMAVAVALDLGPLGASSQAFPLVTLGGMLLLGAAVSRALGAGQRVAPSAPDEVDRVRMVLDELPSGALYLEHNKLVLNPRARQLLGVTAREISLEDWKRLPEVEGAEAMFDASGAPTRQLLTVRDAGEARTLEVLGARVDALDLWTLHDVTERNRARERFQLLFEQSVDAMFLLDTDRIEAANSAARHLLNVVGTASLLGQSIVRFTTHVDELDLADALAMNLARAQRERLVRFPSHVKTRQGVVIPVEVTMSAVELGDSPRTLVIVRDQTTQRQHEDELRRAKEAAESGMRARSEFLATMSHEIRTPLNGVIGLTQVLRNTPLSPDQRSMLDTQLLCAESLLALLNDILDFSKLEAGRVSVERRMVPPASPAEEVVRMLQPRSAERGLSLRLEVPSSLPPEVALDAAHVRQVLLNVVGNAVKFAERGSVVVRVTWDAPDKVVYIVEDTGIGMSQTVIDRLFRPFVQADSSTTREYGGTGLGLAISRRLAELLNGEIRMTSTPGVGTRVVLVVPTAAIAVRQSVTRAPSAPRAERFSGRVLVAEDNPVNQVVTRSLLEHLGLQVVVVGDGEDAVAAVQSGAYDLVLMDCQMPRCDGFEATERLRAAGFSAPVVALTASALDEDRRRCVEVGMNGHMAKPISAEELRAMCARWLPPAGGGEVDLWAQRTRPT